MPIYEITQSAIRKLGQTTFGAAGIRERADLQRLLRSNVDVVSPDTLVVAEEFGQWDESRRRIDLLGLDREANIVVIELKRTEDGGHMELQAIRYAAMVSTMTFEKVVDVYADYLRRIGEEIDARTSILEFLGWEEADEDLFAQDVRIVLASAEFSKELTTAVIWLNEHGLDIRCVRMQPYDDGGRLLVDVQQVIPLPEAAAYQVQVREKEQRGRQERAERYGIRKRFWQGLLSRAAAKTPLHANISPGEYRLDRGEFRDAGPELQLRDPPGRGHGRAVHRPWRGGRRGQQAHLRPPPRQEGGDRAGLRGRIVLAAPRRQAELSGRPHRRRRGMAERRVGVARGPGRHDRRHGPAGEGVEAADRQPQAEFALDEDGCRHHMECQPCPEPTVSLPVLPADRPLRLTPTDVSQFVRLEQCERFLRFRLAERAGQDVHGGVRRDPAADHAAAVPVGPRLRGGRREGRSASDSAPSTTPPSTARSHNRPDNNDEVVERGPQARSPARRSLLFQPRLEAELDGWLLRGDVDLLRLERHGGRHPPRPDRRPEVHRPRSRSNTASRSPSTA